MNLNDFPQTMLEFQERFHDEDACRAFLFSRKWPDGFRCRKCGHDHFHNIYSRGLYECADCRYQESLTVGTVMERSGKPLRLWFLAIYLMATSKRGISASELKRKLGLGSYQTAWTWLQKLRRALADREKTPLSGAIDVDEAYLGGRSKGGKRGRGSESKTPVVAAVERNGGLGRLRLAVIEDVGDLELKKFVSQNVKRGSRIRSDGLKSYQLLGSQGYEHQPVNLSGSSRSGVEVFPDIHRIFAQIKRWLLGTHQGRVSNKHLPAYLEEYSFRFNRRGVKNEGRLAEKLFDQAIRGAAKTYRLIVGVPGDSSQLFDAT